MTSLRGVMPMPFTPVMALREILLLHQLQCSSRTLTAELSSPRTVYHDLTVLWRVLSLIFPTYTRMQRHLLRCSSTSTKQISCASPDPLLINRKKPAPCQHEGSVYAKSTTANIPSKSCYNETCFHDIISFVISVIKPSFAMIRHGILFFLLLCTRDTSMGGHNCFHCTLRS